MADQYTIFGGNGFVGSVIASQLEAQGHIVLRITRANWPARGSALGNVIFTVGMTADFRKRLIETFDLQILRLHQALSDYSFDSFVYLSSARIYAGAASTHEDADLVVNPLKADHTYNLTKLAAENRCLIETNERVRVVRMSNVYGVTDTSNLFLTAVMREAVANGSVSIGQSPQSSKDYLTVDDAARCIILIAQRGQQRLYNVACGSNVTHREIASILEDRNYLVDFKEGSALADFPEIDTCRFDSEFDLKREGLRSGMVRVLKALEQKRETHDRI